MTFRRLAPYLALLVLTPRLTFAEAHKETAMVPMRDGVRLATDLYYPDGVAPWPALLTRTPYGKQGGEKTGLGSHPGVVIVWQDTRGRGASEGQALVFLNDAWGKVQDGYDTIEWLAKQPWCSGKVGTQGSSAAGFVEYLTAPANPPHLAAQWVGVANPSMYQYGTYVGGALREEQVLGWLTKFQWDPVNLTNFRQHYEYDDFWRQVDATRHYGEVHVPTVHQGGWYDTFEQGTIDAFVGYQHQGGEGARGRQRLIIGPWTHGGSQTQVGELTYPDNAVYRGPISSSAWFGLWLAGRQAEFTDQPAVSYYLMGDTSDPNAPGNVWKTAGDWPVPATETKFYLQDHHRLRLQPQAHAAGLSYAYDPKHPVPTLGGNNLMIARGPEDQRKVESRPDVLLFDTAVLDTPLIITGHLYVRLFVSSSAPDTDFTAKLTDVYPDGRSMLVQDGIRRARYRHGCEKPELLTPGVVYALDIDLWSTALAVNKGHRLRLAISSSNYPRFEVNPNTGGPGGPDAQPQVARNKVYFGGPYGAYLSLPLVASL